MRYDPFEKTTKIPFKVLDGKLVHLYDQEPITELQEGITGDLIVKNFAVRDAARIRQSPVGSYGRVSLVSRSHLTLAKSSSPRGGIAGLSPCQGILCSLLPWRRRGWKAHFSTRIFSCPLISSRCRVRTGLAKRAPSARAYGTTARKASASTSS